MKKSWWPDWQTQRWFLTHINVWACTQSCKSGCLLSALSSSNNFSGYEMCLTSSEIQLILLIPQESASMPKTSQIEIPHVAMWRLDLCEQIPSWNKGHLTLYFTLTLLQKYGHMFVSFLSLTKCLPLHLIFNVSLQAKNKNKDISFGQTHFNIKLFLVCCKQNRVHLLLKRLSSICSYSFHALCSLFHLLRWSGRLQLFLIF